MKILGPVLVALVGAAFTVAALGIGHTFDLAWVRTMAFVLGGGTVFGTSYLIQATQKAEHQTDPDSVEYQNDLRVRSAVFVDLLIFLAAAALASILIADIAGWVWALVVMVAGLADYWIRIALLRPKASDDEH